MPTDADRFAGFDAGEKATILAALAAIRVIGNYGDLPVVALMNEVSVSLRESFKTKECGCVD